MKHVHGGASARFFDVLEHDFRITWGEWSKWCPNSTAARFKHSHGAPGNLLQTTPEPWLSLANPWHKEPTGNQRETNEATEARALGARLPCEPGEGRLQLFGRQQRHPQPGAHVLQLATSANFVDRVFAFARVCLGGGGQFQCNALAYMASLVTGELHCSIISGYLEVNLNAGIA